MLDIVFPYGREPVLIHRILIGFRMIAIKGVYLFQQADNGSPLQGGGEGRRRQEKSEIHPSTAGQAHCCSVVGGLNK